MPFLSLSFELGSMPVDAAEQACFDCGALSVTLSDSHDDAVLEPLPGEIRLWPHTRLQALFAADLSGQELVQQLAGALALPATQIDLQQVADKVWEREWLRDFHAMRFGARLWVAPLHETVTAADAIVVRLDPGLAFGTGTHPSTAMCLQWLDSIAPLQGRAIDYGCGSGILAIAAAKLGADAVQAFDIDPQALLATRENAERNGVDRQVQAVEHVAALVPAADILLANILAGTLVQLASELQALVRVGGHFVLAGILREQQEMVVDAFAAWADINRHDESGDWIALAGTRLK